MLVELMRPGGVELARRWLAALLVVDEGEREGVVAAVERQIVETYGIPRDYARGSGGSEEFLLVHPPVQREGYVEQVETTFGAGDSRKAGVTKVAKGGKPVKSAKGKRR